MNDLEKLLKETNELCEDIKYYESIDALGAYHKSWGKICKREYKMNRLLRFAAFLTIPLLFFSIMTGYLYYHQQAENVSGFVEVTASRGSVVRYELSDKSVVLLNSGSTLRFPSQFDEQKRVVELTGEAYFEVHSDKKHPFYVKTSNGLSVYVYGTKFSVSSYAEEKEIGVVLEEGHVNVMTPESERIVLEPNDQFLYIKENNRWSKEKVDVFEKTAWKEGWLIFRNATLDEIFKKLARHFNVEIDYDNRYCNEHKVRATFRDETLYQILDYLSKSVKMEWRKENAQQQVDGTFTKTKIIINLQK